MPLVTWIICFGTLMGIPVKAVNNGLARTPPLGWNNWYSTYCDVSEDLLLDTSQGLVDTGLRDLGYNYVVLDDCWAEDERDNTGHWRADLTKFPHGMKYVADTLHDRGLLFGMYSSAGELTCAGYPGSLGHEKEDAEDLASWNVDYFKYDNCYNLGQSGTALISFNRYKVMGDALNATGRPIVYSLCSWGEDQVHTWGMSIANSWRMSGDIYNSFTRPDALCSCDDERDPQCIAPGTHCSLLFVLNHVSAYADKARPGGWNDLDILQVGIGGMTDEENKAHFALWAAIKSPLLLGHDLRVMDAKTLSIVNNPAILALSQDPLTKPALRVQRDINVPKDKYGIGETHVWSGTLAHGDQVVILLNMANEKQRISVPLEEIFVRDGAGGIAPQNNHDWDVYDLWADRMSDEHAQSILNTADQSAREKIFQELNWYNATEIPYLEGLRKRDPRLMGKKVSVIPAQGVLEVDVPRHAASVFRLRNADDSNTKRRVAIKDEL
ncbi:hypothetical protein B7463_g548, partial [Scytalidium lignicola]